MVSVEARDYKVGRLNRREGMKLIARIAMNPIYLAQVKKSNQSEGEGKD